jgi:hypothetical protein
LRGWPSGWTKAEAAEAYIILHKSFILPSASYILRLSSPVLILVKDAVCSSSDEGHDALLSLFARRYSQRVDTADAEAVPSARPSD